MNIYVLIALCFVPMATLFAIFSVVPREKSIKSYIFACILGILAVAPASFLQFFALKIPLFTSNTFFSVLASAIIFNGFIEESFKMGFLLLIPKKKLTFFIFVFCSILLGSASGGLETAIYLLSGLKKIALSSSQNDALRLIFLRIFTSQIIHILSAFLSGLFIWGSRNGVRHAIIFCYAILTHGLFDFFIAFSYEFKMFAIISLLFAAIECRIWYKKFIFDDEPNEEDFAITKQFF